MNAAWITRASAIPVRQVHLLGGGLLLLAAAALWTYGVKAPLAELRAVKAEQQRLGGLGADPKLLGSQLVALDTGTQALAKRIGAGPAQGSTPLLVSMIRDIGVLAGTHRVTLHSAAPSPEQRSLAFDQVGVDADVTGTYAGLLAWMAAVERSRPNLTIGSFEMRASKTPGQVDM
ncbi:MAG: GspMb/PilO family protein, partial [Telluria sp.]